MSKKRLQVFVSSTYNDLIEERQAAVSAILKAGHIPAGMELFTAADKSQWDTIEEWIDESDVYMLILGGRYGSIEPASGLSYTELEYDYAMRKSKPLFAVVINDSALDQKVKNDGIKSIETDNASRLALFRGKVLSNISSFYDDHKDIKLCIHEALSKLSSQRDLRGWIPGDQAIASRAFLDQVERLTEENEKLKAQLSAINSKKDHFDALSRIKIDEILKILGATKVTIPASEMATGEEWTTDVLNFLRANGPYLMQGIVATSPPTARYRYVAPLLALHGMMRHTPRKGAVQSRYDVTEFGREVLADINAMHHSELQRAKDARRAAATATLSKEQLSSQSTVGSTGTTESSTAKQVRKARKLPAKKVK